MKRLLNIFGGLCVFFGIMWILQGINILPGSFMTGQMKWAVYGAMTLVVGCVMLFVAKRKY
jgi:uncharacterized membrane protein HdeD (DUF308 family)